MFLQAMTAMKIKHTEFFSSTNNIYQGCIAKKVGGGFKSQRCSQQKQVQEMMKGHTILIKLNNDLLTIIKYHFKYLTGKSI